MAPSQPFCNLTNFYFSISPNEYYNNLLEEEWGCFKHIGMSWEMIWSLPIQERRAFIRKHNIETDAIERESELSTRSDSNRTYEGSTINKYAELTQNNQMDGR